MLWAVVAAVVVFIGGMLFVAYEASSDAGCFSSEIDSYRIALEVDGYLTGISPLRARCIVLVGEALVNRGREDA